MSVGHLTTNKSWTQLRKEVEHEAHLWGIDRIELPYKDDSVRRGEVIVKVHRDGVTIPLSCSAFSDHAMDGAERNLCAIREVLRSLRLADQRGIGLVMAQAARDLLALPEGLKPDDPNYILGVRPEMPQSVKKAAYYELVKLYHPDRPEGSREKFELVREAAQKLGLA